MIPNFNVILYGTCLYHIFISYFVIKMFIVYRNKECKNEFGNQFYNEKHVH